MAVSEDTGFPQVIWSWSPDWASPREVASDVTSGLSERSAAEHRKPDDLNLHQADTASFHELL